MTFYNPVNHYWIITSHAGQVFSSSAGDYVADTDPTYLAWLAAGGAVTNNPNMTEDDLGEVLAAAGAPAPVAPGVLDGWKNKISLNIVGQAIFKVLFQHENRIRALEGLGPITVAQARAAIKALL